MQTEIMFLESTLEPTLTLDLATQRFPSRRAILGMNGKQGVRVSGPWERSQLLEDA